MGLTLFLVAISWVFFRCEAFSDALHYLKALAGGSASDMNAIILQADTLVMLVIGFAVVFAPLFRFPRLKRLLEANRVPALAWGLVLLLLCSGRLAVSSFNPFLYFRF